MNSVLFQSKPLSDEVVYSEYILGSEIEKEWLVIYESCLGEYCAKGFNEREEAVKELLSEIAKPETLWQVYGFYHKKAPQDFDLSIRF